MKERSFRRFGLTGGIASGKSTVARILQARGAGVVDADRVARDVVAPGSDGLREIRDAFGPGVLTEHGELDRDAMRAIVFADPVQRVRLESIVHPYIYMDVMRAMEEFETRGKPAGFVEAALLLESPAPFELDAIVVVVCGRETQAERLRVSKAWPEDEIAGVLDAQMSDGERIERAGYVIRNDGSLADLESAVATLWRELISPDWS
ncbi:MAG: dephospho-CoA kinase [Deltaproteobacteria bacterium]|nr:dephospho-CoA kinase [Deltaproteobacteria bacterium]